jgi:peptidoglycan hydrolase CwlO-like protein
MHTFGIVLSVFNAVLAVVFLLVTAPVVQFRVEKQKIIDAEKAKVPVLESEIQGLDRLRVEQQATLTREIGNVRALVTLGQNQRSDLEKDQAFKTDLLNDSESKLALWQSTLEKVRGEIAARETDQLKLTQDLQNLEAELQMHQMQVADLRNRLSEAEQGVAQSKTNIDQLYQQLLKLREQMVARQDIAGN